MEKPSREDLERFLLQVEAGGSINLPLIARQMGLNWRLQVQPALVSDAWFSDGLKAILEEHRYKMLDAVMQVAINGKKHQGKDPELSFIQAAIKFIDKGVMLGPEKEKAQEPEPSEDDEELRKRMGLN